ncbi:MAG: Protein RnfH [Pseudomonadales bacterium]|nr:Protein RnfH [Pseudomonadales bacterium]
MSTDTVPVQRMIRVSVAYALPREHFWREFEVPDTATCAEAIRVSGVLEDFPAIDPARNRIGIFGRIVEPTQRLNDGDRVEIYRPITIVPENLQRRRYRLRQMDPVILRPPSG